MNVAMYLRKSRNEEYGQTIEDTLKIHKKILTETAAKMRLSVLKTYEEVVSGDSLFARPQMLQLLEDIEKNNYDAVLCMDIDRLGRGGMRDQGIILDTFKFSDTKIITPDKTYDLNDDLDEELTEFKTFISRRELKIIKKRLRRGIEQTIKNGGYVANCPYGYERDIISKTPTLKIIDSEAEFVRTMFDMYVNQGIGCQTIAQTINNMGGKPHRSNQFSRTSIRAIIKNPVYIGMICWNKTKWTRKGTNGSDKNIREYLPEEEWEYAKGIHPAIIDDGTFYKAQEILKGRYHPPSNTGEIKNSLAGIIKCRNCGGTMQRSIAQGKFMYIACPKAGCIPSVRLHLLEKSVINYLKDYLYTADVNNHENIQQNLNVLDGIKKSLEAEKNKSQTQMNSLYDLLEQGVYDVDTFMARSALIKDKLSNIDLQLDDICAKIKQNDGSKEKKLREQIEKVVQLFDYCNSQDKNNLLKSVISYVVYNKIPHTDSETFDIEVHFRQV